MKSRYIWAIGVGLLVGLSAGCEDKKQQPVTVAPAPAPTTVAPPTVYPEPAPMPPPVAEAPRPAPAVTEGDVYNPPEETTPIPPEERPHKSTRTAKTAPRNHYAPATPKSGQTYTVKKGDTLQEISKKFYGTTTRWRRIYDANRGTIKGGPEKLMPGMKLTIPAK
jgi:nucleoid-associated protein YgaU